MPRSVGIDFGTTNSVVSVFEGGAAIPIVIDSPPEIWSGFGFDRLMPSVMAVDPDGTRRYGWDAKCNAAERVDAVKRLLAAEEFVDIGGRAMFVEEASALLFEKLKSSAEEEGVPIESAVITVPANSRGKARSRTKIAAAMAGIDVLALLNEPTAAAIAYGINAKEDQNILVVDWGGGTLDVTVLEAIDGVFIERAAKGIQRLGGIDFDSRLLRALLPSVPGALGWTPEERGAFRLSVELAKIRLSMVAMTEIPLPRGGTIALDRQAASAAVWDLVERLREPVEKCLDDLKMKPIDIDHVLLIGGTTKFHPVSEFVEHLLGKVPRATADPLTAVSEGAAVAASILNGENQTNQVFVTTEHALGVKAVLESGADAAFSVIIPRNHKLPVSRGESYYPMRDFQPSVDLVVVEGDPDKPVGHEDNAVLATFKVPIEPPRPAPDARIAVEFSYDTNGILSIEAIDTMSGKTLLDDQVAFLSERTRQELADMASRVKTMARGEEPPDSASDEMSSAERERTLLIRRARAHVIPFIEEDEADRIRVLVDELNSASEGTLMSAIHALNEALRPYSYLF